MTFEETLDQAIAMLQRRQRVTYRTLKLQFHLDDERLEAIKEALIDAEQVAVDEAGGVLIWAPRPAASPTAETLIALRNGLVLLLACVAGSVDALSYVKLGHVFTANMTGNTVLLGLALGQAESAAVLRSSLALMGFLTGAALGAWGADRGRPDNLWPAAITITLAGEGALLIAMAVVWHIAGDLISGQGISDALIVLSALAMGIQSAVGRRLNITGIATTYLTGTLTALITRLVEARGDGSASRANLQRLAVREGAVYPPPSLGLLACTWLIYIGGAAVEAVLLSILGLLPALALPMMLLTAVVLTAAIRFRGT